MTTTSEQWEYCTLKFQLRYKGEDLDRVGARHVWLVFQAVASGPKRNYIAAESTEIPLPANIAGAAFVPQKNNIGHRNVQQNLVRELQAAGWERLPEQGGAWWETRLRRSR